MSKRNGCFILMGWILLSAPFARPLPVVDAGEHDSDCLAPSVCINFTEGGARWELASHQLLAEVHRRGKRTTLGERDGDKAFIIFEHSLLPWEET